MAVDKAIDSTEFDSKLTTVADAIRTAGGTTATMSFPTGMVDAISSLSSGGGGTEELSALLKIFGCSDYEISVVQRDVSYAQTRIHIPITNETLKSSLRFILIPGTNSLFPANAIKKAPILRGPSTPSLYGFCAYIWPYFFDSDIKQRSIISILHYRLHSFVYDEGSSFTQDGTVFVFANNILTIHFDELGSDTGYYDYNFDNLIGTKVLLMGGNVQ